MANLTRQLLSIYIQVDNQNRLHTLLPFPASPPPRSLPTQKTDQKVTHEGGGAGEANQSINGKQQSQK